MPTVSPKKTHAADDRKPAAPPEPTIAQMPAGAGSIYASSYRHPRWSRLVKVKPEPVPEKSGPTCRA